MSEWAPWTLDGCLRMGGYVTQYAGDLSFITVRGSGHMVPQYKPAAAAVMMSRWLDARPPLPYVPTCTAPAK